jgi:hypothetical protein
MSSKKGNNRSFKKPRTTSRSRSGVKLVRIHGDGPVLPLIIDEDSTQYPPVYLNPETAEERDKRLAARKARTIRIFQKAYEAHSQKRKAS